MKGRRRRVDERLIEQLLAEAAGRVPPPTEDELRDLARASLAVPRTPPARAGGTRSHVRWAVGLTAAGLLVGGFGFGLGAWSTPSGSAGTTLLGVGFVPAKGWTVVQSGAAGQTSALSAVAANVKLDPDDDLQDAPYATLEALPARGVLISATFSVRGNPSEDAEFAVQDMPLRVADAERLSASLEPLPVAHNVAQYRLRAAVRRYNVDVRLYFGRSSPTEAQLRVAQSQLDRLVVASEPVTLVARPTVHGGRGPQVTLLGSVASGKANEDVTIEAKECGQTSFRGITVTHTHEGGGWSLQYRPAMNTTLRAVWKDAKSTPVSIQERAWIQLGSRQRPGKGLAFEVEISAKHQFWRRHVVVQRFERRLGRWTDIKKVVLTDTAAQGGSSYVWSSGEFRLFVPRGTLIRAVFPFSQARPCYLTGYSNQLRT